jgi:hypothetical protein
VVEDVVVPAVLVAGVFHQSAKSSPGAGIIAATRMRSSTGRRPHTSGAVKPPSECPTTTTSLRAPIPRTTVSVYSDRPADSSSLGRSTTTGSWPRSRSAGATRCQSQPLPPPPWMSANVATLSGP